MADHLVLALKPLPANSPRTIFNRAEVTAILRVYNCVGAVDSVSRRPSLIRTLLTSTGIGFETQPCNLDGGT